MTKANDSATNERDSPNSTKVNTRSGFGPHLQKPEAASFTDLLQASKILYPATVCVGASSGVSWHGTEAGWPFRKAWGRTHYAHYWKVWYTGMIVACTIMKQFPRYHQERVCSCSFKKMKTYAQQDSSVTADITMFNVCSYQPLLFNSFPRNNLEIGMDCSANPNWNFTRNVFKELKQHECMLGDLSTSKPMLCLKRQETSKHMDLCHLFALLSWNCTKKHPHDLFLLLSVEWPTSHIICYNIIWLPCRTVWNT